MRKAILISGCALVLAACTKYPGEGGRASIEGNVKVERRLVPTNPNTVQDTIPGADVEVYLIYGDHVSPDDRIWTDFDGNFRFRNLRKGEYTLYIYSKDTTGLDGANPDRMPVLRDISIDERKQEIDLGEIFIYDNL